MDKKVIIGESLYACYDFARVYRALSPKTFEWAHRPLQDFGWEGVLDVRYTMHEAIEIKRHRCDDLIIIHYYLSNIKNQI
jgi:hypothetical protein